MNEPTPWHERRGRGDRARPAVGEGGPDRGSRRCRSTSSSMSSMSDGADVLWYAEGHAPAHGSAPYPPPRPGGGDALAVDAGVTTSGRRTPATRPRACASCGLSTSPPCSSSAARRAAPRLRRAARATPRRRSPPAVARLRAPLATLSGRPSRLRARRAGGLRNVTHRRISRCHARLALDPDLPRAPDLRPGDGARPHRRDVRAGLRGPAALPRRERGGRRRAGCSASPATSSRATCAAAAPSAGR